MHYSEGSHWRPLFETTQAALQIATGCGHNACKFCTMYKKVPFRLSDRAEIEADIEEMARIWLAAPERIFLTGGNAFGVPQDHLVFALRLIREQLPRTKSVGCFARVGDVKGKTDNELRELATLGIDDIAIGAESGYDPALAFMGKGHTAADIVKQCARLDAVGIAYDLFYLAGIAGASKWEENVRATVEVYGQTHPRRIMVHTLTRFEGAPLLRDIECGDFVPEDELDILRELRMLCAELPISTFILAAHNSNVAPFNARLPEDRDEVLAFLDRKIERGNEETLRAMRREVKSM